MLSLDKPFALLSVIVPCTKKVVHDHSYCSPEERGTSQAEVDDRQDTPTLDISSYLTVDAVTEDSLLGELCVTQKEREELEKETKSRLRAAVGMIADGQELLDQSVDKYVNNERGLLLYFVSVCIQNLCSILYQNQFLGEETMKRELALHMSITCRSVDTQ